MTKANFLHKFRAHLLTEVGGPQSFFVLAILFDKAEGSAEHDISKKLAWSAKFRAVLMGTAKRGEQVAGAAGVGAGKFGGLFWRGACSLATWFAGARARTSEQSGLKPRRCKPAPLSWK